MASEAVEPESSAGDEPPAGGADSGGPRTEAQPPPAGPPEVVTGPAGQDAGPAGQNAPTFDEVVSTWPAIVHKLGETSPALAATFDGARPVSLDVEGLKIGFPAELTFNKKKAETPEKRDLMADAIEETLGERIKPTYVLLDGEPAREGTAAEGEIDHDALLEKLKSEFDAKEVG